MHLSSVLAVFAVQFAPAPGSSPPHHGSAPFVVVGAIVAAILYHGYRRRQALEALAQNHHLEFLGNELPPDFPREMLGKLGSWYHFGRWRRSANVISGMEGSDRLVAFDAVVGRGRNQFTQTWVARRVSGTPRPPSITGNFIYRQEGSWRAVARQRQFLTSTRLKPTTIEEIWQRLR